ncbi:hypothetical protein BDV18DRAFT_158157 [Aspergillus unguis]
MTCTTYETMCARCKFHYTKLRQAAQPASALEYPSGTYPVIFNCHITLDLGLRPGARIEVDHGSLAPLVAKLEEHCKQRPRVFTHCASTIEGGSAHIYQSILIDYPCKIEVPHRWRAWVSEYVSVGVYQWAENGMTAKPKAYYSTGVDDWRAVLPPNQDHLCWTRLQWFMTKVGMTPFL